MKKFFYLLMPVLLFGTIAAQAAEVIDDFSVPELAPEPVVIADNSPIQIPSPAFVPASSGQGNMDQGYTISDFRLSADGQYLESNVVMDIVNPTVRRLDADDMVYLNSIPVPRIREFARQLLERNIMHTSKGRVFKPNNQKIRATCGQLITVPGEAMLIEQMYQVYTGPKLGRGIIRIPLNLFPRPQPQAPVYAPAPQRVKFLYVGQARQVTSPAIVGSAPVITSPGAGFYLPTVYPGGNGGTNITTYGGNGYGAAASSSAAAASSTSSAATPTSATSAGQSSHGESSSSAP